MLRTLAFIAAATVATAAFAEDKIPVSNSNLYQKVAEGEVAPQAAAAKPAAGQMHPSAYAKPSTKAISKKPAKKSKKHSY